jgi:hypothetical protein
MSQQHGAGGATALEHVVAPHQRPHRGRDRRARRPSQPGCQGVAGNCSAATAAHARIVARAGLFDLALIESAVFGLLAGRVLLMRGTAELRDEPRAFVVIDRASPRLACSRANGEGGIRTLERGNPRYAISSRARSTAPAPLQAPGSVTAQVACQSPWASACAATLAIGRPRAPARGLSTGRRALRAARRRRAGPARPHRPP